jgi:FKBP-type peptidyl-prolyl cis-trans isomerase SlyD
MTIADKKAVSIDYTLKGDDGEVLDSSEGKKPLVYLHGAENIVPGLEKALAGKQVGETIKVVVPPAEGYGERSPALIQKVPVRKLPDKRPQVGATYRVMTTDGPRLLTVIEVKGDYATVDGNHPLAGQTLHFEVTVREIRDASAEELEHGHPHGPDGHHH